MRTHLALGLLLLAVGPAEAIPPAGSEEWQPLRFPKIENATKYDVVDVDGRPVLRAQSECSASALVIDLQGQVDLFETPLLSWRWKVERGLDIADERSRAGDDFAARVYLMFEFDSESAGLFERVAHGLGERIYGRTIPGHAINYVWTSHVPAGTDWLNPYSESAHMLAIRSGPGDGWRDETVDVLKDHRRLVGEPRTPLLALAVMSDSDTSCEKATAYYSDFRFLPADAGRDRPQSLPDEE